MLVMLPAGKTEAERDKIYIGRDDSPLLPEAVDASREAALTLAVYMFDRAWTSDLYRAQSLSDVVKKAAHYPLEIELAEELRERSAGSYEGLPYSEIRKGMSPKAYKVWDRDPIEAPLHGESLQDVLDRIKPWFDQEIRPLLDDNKNVLLISHPDVIKVLIALVRGDHLTDVVSSQIEHCIPYFYHGVTR